MIIAKLTGGLGNQMFQYAAARRLACLHNAALKLDISFLDKDLTNTTPRTFQLNHLAVTASIATPHEVAKITGEGKSALQSVLSRVCTVIGMSQQCNGVFNERSFNFDPDVLVLPDNTYLAGYWQSEKYFQDIKEIIRREFTVKYPLEGRNKEASDLICATNSVSLHVRRGDFAADPNIRELHGICSPDYYRRSVEQLSSRVGKLHLFIFSDEPSWAVDNLHFTFQTTFVDQNSPDNGYEDLRLMSLCKYHIIANSSFSWWGAWLSASPNKLVIAPDQWFNDSSLDTRDLIPPDWQRL